MSEDTKKFTPFDKDIKLVSKPSDIDPLDVDPSVLRAVLSCGHVTDPETLTDYCKVQLDDGKTEFKCPQCEKKWPYDEVRTLAKLTINERCNFEDKLGTNTVKETVNFVDCPGCGIFTERSDVSNLCVECSVCTANNRKPFKFCWQCVREWRGPQPRADRCGNVGCKLGDLELLRDCPVITVPCVGRQVQCPTIRACTSCGLLIQYDQGCNNMKCSQCKKIFCFVCLQSGHYKDPCTLAPRQINSSDM